MNAESLLGDNVPEISEISARINVATTKFKLENTHFVQHFSKTGYNGQFACYINLHQVAGLAS